MHKKIPPKNKTLRNRPKHWAKLLCGILSLGSLNLGSFAAARQVFIGGKAQASAIDTQMLGQARITEGIAVWMLPKLGISVRNDPQDVRLLLGKRELRYSATQGWQALGFRLSQKLPEPEVLDGSLYVPLAALPLLGMRYAENSNQVRFLAPLEIVTTTLPPSQSAPTDQTTPTVQADQSDTSSRQPSQTNKPNHPQTDTEVQQPASWPSLKLVRAGHQQHRNIATERIVLELDTNSTDLTGYQLSKDQNYKGTNTEQVRLTLQLPQIRSKAKAVELSSGTQLALNPNSNGLKVEIDSSYGHHNIFALKNPARLVIDSTKLLNNDSAPPINPEKLPEGVSYQQRGGLHLLSFDPQLYRTEVVSAPTGETLTVSKLVQQAGGIAGINGGYFDISSLLPVDLVVQNGLMTAGSLERRATLGFTAQGQVLVGFPKPRYVLSGPFGKVMVNSVRSQANDQLLTAFLGNGQTSVGRHDMLTIYIQPQKRGIQRVILGDNVPPKGMLALTFHPQKFPQLPNNASQPLEVYIDWRTDESLPWGKAVHALSAGPLMVKNGRAALDPQKENFNFSSGVFKLAPQSAYGLRSGKPTLAYLELGTPSSFASALAGAGFSVAVRLDSGSSSTIYTEAGYGPYAGYTNTRWGRKVVNALVMVPKNSTK